MKKFVTNCDDNYWDMKNDKTYNIPKGTEIIFVEEVDGDIMGTINNGEGKGLTIMFPIEELDECK